MSRATFSSAVLALAEAGELVHSLDGMATCEVVEVVEVDALEPGTLAPVVRRDLYLRYVGGGSGPARVSVTIAAPGAAS